MIVFAIISKLPESDSTDSKYHFFSADVSSFCYTSEDKAKMKKAELDKEYPDWVNEVRMLIVD